MSAILPVLLAGGGATRFGDLARVVPKAFLPASAHESLLGRLLRQLEAVGFSDALLSTSPNQQAIFELLLARQAELQRRLRVRVFANAAHHNGPVAALARIIAEINAPYALLCLPDICFAANPLASWDHACTNVLFGCPPQKLPDLPRSGWLQVHEGAAVHLSYALRDASEYVYWPGLAAFECAALRPHLEVAAGVSDAPLESVFEAAMGAGVRFRWIECPPFINVNTPEDWLDCLKQNWPPCD